MPRRGADRPGLIDWIVLAAAAALGLAFLLAGSGARIDAACFLRATLLRPYRLVLGFHSAAADPWKETRALRREMAERSLDETRLEELVRETARLRDLLDIRAAGGRSLAAAPVVGRQSDGFGEILAVLRPESAGVRAGQTVVGMRGLIGTVLDTDAEEVRVRTVRNGALQVNAMLVESREVGLLRWRPAERIALLEGIPLHVPVKEGELVITSGYGRIFPKGITIGAVAAVRDDSTSLARSIRVRLAEELDRTEEVFLVLD